MFFDPLNHKEKGNIDKEEELEKGAQVNTELLIINEEGLRQRIELLIINEEGLRQRSNC